MGTRSTVVSENMNSPDTVASPALAPSDINLSKLAPESRELFNCITLYFDRIMAEKDSRISKLEEEAARMKDRIDTLENELDSNAAYLRRETLIISGDIPIGHRNENCKSIIVDMLRQGVNINVSANDISVAHRVGILRQQGPDRRGIMFKLCRRDLKYDILSACRQQKPKFFINESLTPTRNRILYILRRSKQKYPAKIRSIRSFEGSVTVYLSPLGRPLQGNVPLSQLRRVTINTRRQLERLLEAELQTNLQELGLPWERE